MVLLLPTFMLRMVTSIFSISSLIRSLIRNIKKFNIVKPSIEAEQI